MAPSQISGRWRRVLRLLVVAHAVAACAGVPPAASLPASPAAVAPSTPGASSPAASSLVSPTPGPTRTPAPGPYAGIAIVKVEAQSILLLKRDVGFLAATADSVWAATSVGLIRIDPRTLEIQDVDSVPRFGLAATTNAVWVSDFDGGTVSRFDPARSRQAASVELPGNPNAIAVFGDSIWVAQHRGGSVTRLKGPSAKLVAVVEVGPVGSSGPHAVAADKTAVWVGITNIQSVVRIDPSTNHVVATIPTKTSPCGGIALQPDAVWVSSCFDDRMAVRIDPRSNTVVTEIDIGGHNGGPVLVDGYPWFPVGNLLVRIDPATNRIDRIVQFWKTPDFDAYGSTVAFDSVWVGGTGRIARIPLAAVQD